jgi:hypothetical protein
MGCLQNFIQHVVEARCGLVDAAASKTTTTKTWLAVDTQKSG